MRRIYCDTNQLYYVRRIGDEADGWDFGDYQWAYRRFPDNPELVGDIRALCYIVALQYEWELDFLPSNASFAELHLSNSARARATREAWALFAEGLNEGQYLRSVPFQASSSLTAVPILDFIEDTTDRIIVRDAISERAEVLLTSDDDILRQAAKIAALGVNVMRASRWLKTFLAAVTRDGEDPVDWLERVLFGVGNRI